MSDQVRPPKSASGAIDTPTRRPLRTKPFLLALCGIVATLTVFACDAYLHQGSNRSTPARVQRAPLNANAILTQCAQLNAVPGPPADFDAREVSDRYEPGTGPTHIRNATIWTGARNGTEVVYGDVYLEKGLVKRIGYIPKYVLDAAENLTVVDAHGGWVTPGLGGYCTVTPCAGGYARR